MHLYSVAVVVILTSLVVCENDHGKHAISYDEETFNEALNAKSNFVMFFAPWCGHCKNLAPTWDELAKLYNAKEDSPVVIAKVDCTVHTKLCSQHEIMGFPTIKLFHDGDSEPKRYSGRRDLESLKSYLVQNLNGLQADTKEDEVAKEKEEPAEKGLIQLTDDDFDRQVSEGLFFIKFYAPWCGHCKRLAPTWDELAESFSVDDSVAIAKIDCEANPVTCRKHNINGYPTLLLFNNGQQVKSYESDRSLAALNGFVKQEMKLLSDQENTGEDELPMDVHEPGKVKELTSDNFDLYLSDKLVFVKFYAPWCGHCKRLAPTWDDLAKELEEEAVSIAKVDCTQHKSVCDDHQVKGYPTLKIFRDGSKLEDYRQSRTLESLTTFVRGHLVGHDEL